MTTGPKVPSDVSERKQESLGLPNVPESSRRARAVPVYAAIRSLGRASIAELIERNCAQARRVAERLGAIPRSHPATVVIVGTRLPICLQDWLVNSGLRIRCQPDRQIR